MLNTVELERYARSSHRCCMAIYPIYQNLTESITPGYLKSKTRKAALGSRLSTRSITAITDSYTIKPLSRGRQAPARSVDDDAHQAARNDTGDGEGDDPAEVNPGDHAPVDGAPCAGAETDADGGASDALRGGDRELCEIVST